MTETAQRSTQSVPKSLHPVYRGFLLVEHQDGWQAWEDWIRIGNARFVARGRTEPELKQKLDTLISRREQGNAGGPARKGGK